MSLITPAMQLDTLPPELAVIIISMMPFAELRGGIPIALGLYNMGTVEAYTLSVFGNLLPVIPLLLLLEPVEKKLRYISIFNDFFDWLFSRTRGKLEYNMQKYGILGLTLFVAVPLPATGAWTGAAAAYVFGIKFKYSFPAIVAGVLIAGLIVTFAYTGGSLAYNAAL